MEFYPFPAQFVTAYNSINEFGHASFSSDGMCLDFTADFIPLVPLGTPAVINWILGNKVLESFVGKVYLSSNNRLRLVSIYNEKLKEIKQLFEINTNLPAAISFTSAQGTKQSSNVSIFYLSKTCIKLKAHDYIGAGQELALNTNIEFLTLDNAILIVQKRVLLSRMDAFLVCEVFPKQSDENLIALATYSARLEKQHNTR